MERIGVRELRQHASRYLERVRRGESLEVTDRGQPVARLVPVRTDLWAALVSSGRVRPAQGGEDVAAEAPGSYGVEATAALAALRLDER
ncbi:MAG TPA: type II toxin-antitoxin system prevent-host-death family antitoxin [Intrasporangium sp.]|uniref:type II toxin-antitoxin system Phd/YefM family antitoxin n=1 Tax=Intrasporangium sp. TaxID=1925024 RepID=UPI002D7847AD|nr:type II toxin-antitoxin system prevent-host-death family antitoxin [Intrasporangium sp.]HET7399068.1 type II toxin-antitoxin system prevent-host-death family antitoxin [Intrasporangium sp.]